MMHEVIRFWFDLGKAAIGHTLATTVGLVNRPDTKSIYKRDADMIRSLRRHQLLHHDNHQSKS